LPVAYLQLLIVKGATEKHKLVEPQQPKDGKLLQHNSLADDVLHYTEPVKSQQMQMHTS
jgi:hypothetical protein